MSANLRQSFLMSALSDLSDGARWFGPSGSFRSFRWLPRHYYPELWMSDPGRQGALVCYPFEILIPSANLFSRETPPIEHARRYFVKGYNQVFQAYRDIPHRIYAVEVSGFAMLAVFTGTFRLDRAPLRIDLSFMRRAGPMPTISDTRQCTTGRFLRAICLSPGQSALWVGEVLRTSDTEESALSAALIEMQMRRPDIAELFKSCRRAYPAYYIGRAGQRLIMMLGFGPEDPPALLLVIDQPDNGAILQKEARRRNRWRQAEKVRESFARSR
jgi:hypothetical protein